MINNKNIDKVIKILKKEVEKYKEPTVETVAEKTKDPFKILVSTMLSLRTKDNVTAEASSRLFKLGTTPERFLELPLKTIEKAIYPVGFYRVKAKNIKLVSFDLVNKYNSKVPDDINELLKLKGVGRKTANLVVTLGFNKYGICVDTHVHRIMNRWGYVKSKSPKETEFILRRKLPKKYWKTINNLLVTYGQNVCKPVSPFCSSCKLHKFCGRIDVLKNR
jgi:endonuclease-3